MKVFISCAKGDQEIARKLYEDLKQVGVTPWLETKDLLPGQNRRVIISQALKESQYVLVLLSPKSLTERGSVQKEIKSALDILDEFPLSEIFIIPVYIEKCTPIDERLQNLHGVELFSSYEVGLNQILRVLLPKKSDRQKSTDDQPVTSDEDSPHRQRIQIYLQGDFSSLSLDRRSAVIDAFAALMGISPQTIEVYRIYEGSIVFDLGIPLKAVRRLRSVLKSNSEQLRLLKVEKVILISESGETEEWNIMSSTKTILILAANPIDTLRLRLDKEVREIDEGLRRSKHREQFVIRSSWAVRLRDLRRALLDYEPQIVHFCGHGKEEGLKLEDETGNTAIVSPEALAGLFELFSTKVECVLLNACYSELQADAISRHISYVIGMKQGIEDKVAIEFAIGFYDALGGGRTYKDAFKFGRNAIQLSNLPEDLIPVLKKKSDGNTTMEPIPSIEFVNRVNELNFITNIYCPPYLLISAPPGYGKSRLVENIKERLQQQNWLCVHLKLSRKRRYSIQELATNILRQLGQKQIESSDIETPERAGYAIGASILKALRNNLKKVLLLVDEAEALEEKITKQLLNHCIPAIKEGLNVADTSIRLWFICTGRYLSHWTQWGTRLPLELMPLTSFDFPAVYETVEKFASTSDIKIAPEYRKDFAAHLMYFTGGHPGCMIDILRKDYGSPGGLIVSNENEYYEAIVEPVIEEIREHIPLDLQEIFETLSVIRYFNPRLLRYFIDKRLIIWDKSEYELESLLCQTYLVNPESGFLKDDIVRRLFAIRLRKTNSDHFIRVCEEAISFYTSRLQEPRSNRPDIVAVELLFQKLQYLVYKQHGDKKQFFEILNEILKILVSERDPWGVMEGFMEILGKDWEFRFTLNYLLRERIYSDEYPFKEFMERIENFKQSLQGGN